MYYSPSPSAVAVHSFDWQFPKGERVSVRESCRLPPTLLFLTTNFSPSSSPPSLTGLAHPCLVQGRRDRRSREIKRRRRS